MEVTTMPITDTESFIAGVQVGRRMKEWDAKRKPLGGKMVIFNENSYPLLDEDGIYLLTEKEGDE